MLNLHIVYVTSVLESIDLNMGRSSLAGARHFSPLHLHRGLERYNVSLAIDVVSESAPPLSGEDGGELASTSSIGCTFFGGLPLGLEAGAMGTFSPLAPLSFPTGVGGVLPTNTGPTSDLLEKGAPSMGPCGSVLSL